jgi:hypothetical protein
MTTHIKYVTHLQGSIFCFIDMPQITVNPDGGLPDKWKELDSGIGTKSVWDIWTGMGSLWVAGQRGTGHVSFAYNGKCRWDSENYNEPMKHCGDCRAGGWTASELNCKTERKADTNADPKADLKDITERVSAFHSLFVSLCSLVLLLLSLYSAFEDDASSAWSLPPEVWMSGAEQ